MEDKLSEGARDNEWEDGGNFITSSGKKYSHVTSPEVRRKRSLIGRKLPSEKAGKFETASEISIRQSRDLLFFFVSRCGIEAGLLEGHRCR